MTTLDLDPVATAEKAVKEAEQVLQRLEDRLRSGSPNVTNVQLSEAAWEIHRRELLVEYARRLVESPDWQRQQEAAARLERRREERRQAAQVQRIEERKRAIESGATGTWIAESWRSSGRLPAGLAEDQEHVDLLIEAGLLDRDLKGHLRWTGGREAMVRPLHVDVALEDAG